VLLRQAAGVAKGAHLAGREVVASVTMDQIEEIAKTKLRTSTPMTSKWRSSR